MSLLLRHCPPSHFSPLFPPPNNLGIIDKITSARRGPLFTSINRFHNQFLQLFVAHPWVSRCYCTLAAQKEQEAVRLRANATDPIPPRCFVPVPLVVRLNHSCWLSVPDQGSTSTDEGIVSSPVEPRQGRNARHSSAAGSARNCPPACREWPAVSARPSVSHHPCIIADVECQPQEPHTSR